MLEAPRSPGEKQPIIVADADEENARHLERQLRRAGVKNPVVRFSSGDDLGVFFVETALNDDPKPCVLFLDPRMPGANGYDPIRWAKRETCLNGMKMAILSFTETPEEIASASELGVQLFLKKHPDLTSLAPILEHLQGVRPAEVASKTELPVVPAK
jgi:CheY-like chemotaxis protein